MTEQEKIHESLVFAKIFKDHCKALSCGSPEMEAMYLKVSSFLIEYSQLLTLHHEVTEEEKEKLSAMMEAIKLAHEIVK